MWADFYAPGLPSTQLPNLLTLWLWYPSKGTEIEEWGQQRGIPGSSWSPTTTCKQRQSAWPQSPAFPKSPYMPSATCLVSPVLEQECGIKRDTWSWLLFYFRCNSPIQKYLPLVEMQFTHPQISPHEWFLMNAAKLKPITTATSRMLSSSPRANSQPLSSRSPLSLSSLQPRL